VDLKERVVLGDLIQAGTGLDENLAYGLSTKGISSFPHFTTEESKVEHSNSISGEKKDFFFPSSQNPGKDLNTFSKKHEEVDKPFHQLSKKENESEDLQASKKTHDFPIPQLSENTNREEEIKKRIKFSQSIYSDFDIFGTAEKPLSREDQEEWSALLNDKVDFENE
jgi:hypothetical protein